LNSFWIFNISFCVFIKANSLLIVLIKIIPKYCPEKCTSLKLDPINFLQIFISVENLLIVSILINYLVLTIKFNRSKKLPDISKEIDRPIFTPSQLKDVGYKDSSYLSNILENQADMIRYLQERNATLTHKLYSKSNTNIANINWNMILFFWMMHFFSSFFYHSFYTQHLICYLFIYYFSISKQHYLYVIFL
jgi:hypothetical protein